MEPQEKGLFMSDTSLLGVETAELVPADAQHIEKLVYMVRGQQVMLDYDLARLYQVETKTLNRAASRNSARFPEDFRFQLTREEFDNLRCQIGTSSEETTGHGGRRYLPYAYTEQGISMLSGVLRSDVAVQVSIGIMRAFVEMRKMIANISLLFERISSVELKQLAFQQETNEKLDRLFDYINTHTESSQKIFFDGQIYDAFRLLIDLIKRAEKDIVLVDGYVDVGTLNLLAKKRLGVAVEIYTFRNTRLTAADVSTFNQQYPHLDVKYTSVFHDRFLILDHKIAYHIGASLKDAGRKCFAVNELQDSALLTDLLNRLQA